MPRTAIYTEEEIKQRQNERVYACHVRRMQNDEEYRKRRCVYQKNYMKRKQEELQRYKDFYEQANKEQQNQEK